jgi:CubicO group peptidase (beta-lactamase class C family)
LIVGVAFAATCCQPLAAQQRFVVPAFPAQTVQPHATDKQAQGGIGGGASAAPFPAFPNTLAGASFKDELDQEIEEYFAEKNLPGIVVLYARDGLLTYKKTLGFADVQNNVKMTENHIGRLNSVSKWAGAIISLKQVEKGQFNLDVAAKSYLPNLPAHHTYKVKDLLSCRSGIRHYGESTSPLSPGDWGDADYATAAEAAPMFWNDPLAAPIGAYHYSTHGYTIQAACLEAALDQPIADIVKATLSTPFGLSTLDVEDLDDGNPLRMKFYEPINAEDLSQGNKEVQPSNSSWKVLGGGLQSSAMDLLKLGILLGDNKIIAQANVKKMMTRVEAEDSYCLGCNHAVENGNHVMAKSGSWPGSCAYIWLVPERRMVMAIMINRDTGASASGLGKKLRDVILAADKADGEKPDLVVQDFVRTAAPHYKDGKLEIPVRFKVVNQGKAGVDNSFVNCVQIGAKDRWTGFMDVLPPSGASKTVNAVVKIPDPSKLLAGRTLSLIAFADAPIAAADTSMPWFGRVSEASEVNNKAKLSVKVPGGLDLTAPTPGTHSGTKPPQRVTGNAIAIPPTTIKPRVPQRVPTVEPPSTPVPTRVPGKRIPARPGTKKPTRTGGDSQVSLPDHHTARLRIDLPRTPPSLVASTRHTPPFAGASLPDLRIREFRFPISQPKVVHVVVGNAGPVAAGPSVLRLTVRRINGTPIARTENLAVPALASAQSVAIAIDATSILPNSIDLKSTTFRLDVDATSVVNESNEVNNLEWHNL